MQTLDAVYKTAHEEWMIGTDDKRESKNFVLSARFNGGGGGDSDVCDDGDVGDGDSDNDDGDDGDD